MTPTPSNANASLKKLKAKRTSIKGSLTRLANWLDGNSEDVTTLNIVKTRQQALTDLYNQYDNVQSQIEEFDEAQEADRDSVEIDYYNTFSKFQDLIDSFTLPVTPRASSSTVAGAKIPELKIPTFNGDFSKWTSFFDIFSTLIIKNNTLSNVQRLMHLKGCLTGEPLNLISNLQLTSSNFQIAIQTLSDRYSNNLITINCHIKALLELPSLVKLNAQNLRDFVTAIKQNVEALKGLNVPVDQWDLLLIYINSQKLDYNTRRSYELERDRSVLPTLDGFLNYLENRCIALECLNFETLNVSKDKEKPKPRNFQSHPHSQSYHVTAESHKNEKSFEKKCLYCDKLNHTLYSCLKFKELSYFDRKNFVQAKQLCFNCLGSKHSSENCNSQYTCMLCKRRHHSLLHNSENSSRSQRNPPRNNSNNYTQNVSQNRHASAVAVLDHVTPNNTSFNPPGDPSAAAPQTYYSTQTGHVTSHSYHSANNVQVLLATAVVTLEGRNGDKINAKALLDSGSQSSLITGRLAERIGRQTYSSTVHISGISNSNIYSNKMIDISVKSKSNAGQSFTVSCSILENITCPLPQTLIDIKKLNLPQNIILADPEFFKPSNIDVLLGADIFFELITHGSIDLGQGLPILFNTHLGYVIGGKLFHNVVRSHLNIPTRVSCFAQASPHDTNSNLESLIENFWKIEDCENLKTPTPSENHAEEIFKTTTKRLENGQFQVEWPLINSDAFLKLGNSFGQASNRFFSLEKKFANNKNLFMEYKKFIDDYLDKDYATIVPLKLENAFSQNKYFLPHHCVIREESKSTKLRVVLDASMKTTTGYSLNDIVLKGFQVQPELYDILLRFRAFNYVLTTDIQKMFLQIRINPEQRFLQNILWRETPSDDLKCLELSTVFFGNKSSPFLATRCLLELAGQEMDAYPLASDALLKQCYMDDILAGVNSQSDLYVLKDQLSSLLQKAGFSLHKWCTNLASLENLFKYDPGTSQPENYEIKMENVSSKVLGLNWKPALDIFVISPPTLDNTGPYTKRKVLSIIASMFDPLGFVSPVIVLAKIIMQKIWISKLEWDDVLSENLLNEWVKFLKYLPALNNLKIPRSLKLDKKIGRVELHGFSDASARAYACCLYFRVIYEDKSISCNLICAKTRVAPIKKNLSIARLELCGCLLLSKLTKRVLQILEGSVAISGINLWSDSQVCLCWIKSSPSRWTVFVSNRVTEIQSLVTDSQWRYVPTEKNPADFASRGLLPNKMENCSLWWKGPDFLYDLQVNLDTFKSLLDNKNFELLEEKQISLVTVNNEYCSEFWDTLFEKFSSYSRLNRVVAYLLRYFDNYLQRHEKNLGPLTVDELKKAQVVILRQVQKKHFPREFSDLKSGKPIRDKNIFSLNPFVDEVGLIRVGGRLSNASVSYDQKHPILLPSKDPVVHLLMQKEHISLLHAGAQTVLFNFRTKFWPLGGLRAIKKIIKSCVVCFQFNAKSAQQIMADLPRDRVTPTRVFAKVGVDFGGPLLIRSSRLRKAPSQKCYIAVFVCMVSKAVHIELVSALSTEAFILTLKRFVARRGCPDIIFSDNATNFVGTRNHLRDLYTLFKNKNHTTEIEVFLSTKLIEWKFIPPRSPHWGGLWEAAIKSAKHHIHRIVGNSNLTFEELSTVLAQIEAILNSRPLLPLSDDPTDLNFLTPGHFLVGHNLTAVPEHNLCDISPNRLSSWQHCTKLQQDFWKKWSVDYLNRLQNRPKWLQPSANLNLNDLVLLKEDNLPPLNWRRGRVIELFPGTDGKVRVVKVQTREGNFLRSITKICPFPKQ